MKTKLLGAVLLACLGVAATAPPPPVRKAPDLDTVVRFCKEAHYRFIYQQDKGAYLYLGLSKLTPEEAAGAKVICHVYGVGYRSALNDIAERA